MPIRNTLASTVVLAGALACGCVAASHACVLLPPAAAPVLKGVEPGNSSAPRVRVSIRLVAHECSKITVTSQATTTSRIKIGSCITVQLTSRSAGKLVVFNRDAEGKTVQIHPNAFARGGQVGETPASVRAGQVVTLPGPADGFEFKVSGPLGRNEIIAVVVPQGVNLEESVRAGIAARTMRRVGAVGTHQFEVVK